MSRWNYFLHLTLWILPLIAGQWVIGWRVFRRNLRAILVPAVAGGVFFSVCDAVAIHAGIWIFDPRQNLGVFFGPLPLEEALFFLLTSWLVAQSLVLLLPAGDRH